MNNNEKLLRRKKVHRRIRSRIVGTAEVPRLNVFKSSKHIYAQLIDDANGVTLAAASTQSGSLADELKGKAGVEKAGVVGKFLGERAKESGITKVVFDRNGYKYHGRVKALADGARESGLVF